MKILLDNGHGIETPGKRSPDGRLREYAYTREIAARVNAGLNELGLSSSLLVTELADISLDERCRRVNAVCRELGRENVILISIHVNAAGRGDKWMKATGWSCYTSRGVTRADELATCLCNSAIKNLPGHRMRFDYSDGDPDHESGFAILNHTACPAVLTENLFQDSLEDVEFLLSEEGKAAITQLHIDGIAEFVRKCT